MSEPTSGPFTSSRLPGSHQSNPPTQLRDSTLATVVLKWELEILRDIDVIEKELTVEYDTEPGRGADDSDGMDISSGGETETQKGDLGEEGSDNWRYRIDLLGLRVELLGVLRKMAMGEIGAEDVAAISKASFASFLS